MHGNFLLDVLESSYSVDQIAILENIFKNNATIPFLNLNEKNDFTKNVFVIDSYGNKKLIRDIYNEIEYPINRGPIYYVSHYVLNYSFETYIIITQDGMICQNPNNHKEVAFYAWDNWKVVLYTKHKDLEGGVILLAYPLKEGVIEISLSPILDFKKNIHLNHNEIVVNQKPSYTKIAENEMNFGSIILKNLYDIVNINRGNDLNTIPIEKLYIFHEPNSIQSLI
jgi:hypothetical protein